MRPHVAISRDLATDTVQIMFSHCTGYQGFLLSEEQYESLKRAVDRDRERVCR